MARPAMRAGLRLPGAPPTIKTAAKPAAAPALGKMPGAAADPTKAQALKNGGRVCCMARGGKTTGYLTAADASRLATKR